MGTALDTLMQGLTESLSKAVSGDAAVPTIEDDIADLQKSVDDLSQRLDTLVQTFAPGDDKGEGAGPFAKMLKDMKDTVDTHHTVLEKMLDRSAAPKQADGDDFDGNDAANAGDGAEPVKKARGGEKAGSWDTAIRFLAANPGKRVTLR